MTFLAFVLAFIEVNEGLCPGMSGIFSAWHQINHVWKRRPNSSRTLLNPAWSNLKSIIFQKKKSNFPKVIFNNSMNPCCCLYNLVTSHKDWKLFLKYWTVRIWAWRKNRCTYWIIKCNFSHIFIVLKLNATSVEMRNVHGLYHFFNGGMVYCD